MIKKILIIFTTLVIYSCNNAPKSENTVDPKTEVINGISYSTFKVWGNCGMCKSTIEGSLKLDGISEVNWDSETKIMKVAYDSTKITFDQIQKRIANVGYDTPNYTAKDSTYNELHECCKYDRKK